MEIILNFPLKVLPGTWFHPACHLICSSGHTFKKTRAWAGLNFKANQPPRVHYTTLHTIGQTIDYWGQTDRGTATVWTRKEPSALEARATNCRPGSTLGDSAFWGRTWMA